jgi:hypothetical protein
MIRLKLITLHIIGDLSPFIELKETLMESSISQRNNNGILRTTNLKERIPHSESGAFRIQEVELIKKVIIFRQIMILFILSLK